MQQRQSFLAYVLRKYNKIYMHTHLPISLYYLLLLFLFIILSDITTNHSLQSFPSSQFTYQLSSLPDPLLPPSEKSISLTDINLTQHNKMQKDYTQTLMPRLAKTIQYEKNSSTS